MTIKDIVLVCLAVIAIPCAEWLITQIYSYSSRGWKSKIEVQAGLVSGRNSPWFTDANLSLCPHTAEGTRERSGVPRVRALIPLTRAPPS